MSRDDLLLIVEDDEQVGAQLVRWVFPRLGASDRLVWVRSVEEARRFIVDGPAFAGYLVDYRLGDGTALDVLDVLDEREARDVPVLVFSGDADDAAARAIDERGARFVPKPCGLGTYRRLLSEVDRRLARRRDDREHLERRAQPERITRAEWQVLEAYLDGADASAIASTRRSSIATVETHLKRVVAKCGFRSRQHLVRSLLARRRRGGGATLIPTARLPKRRRERAERALHGVRATTSSS